MFNPNDIDIRSDAKPYAKLFPHRPGDFRGPYGFRRPAHKTDPNATYVFQPQPGRTLPIRDRLLLARLYQPNIDPLR